MSPARHLILSKRYQWTGGVVALVALVLLFTVQDGRGDFPLGMLAFFFAAVVAGVCFVVSACEERKARRYRERLAEDHCPECGYDLVLSRQRCPECGRVVLPSERYPNLTSFLRGWFAAQRIQSAGGMEQILADATLLDPGLYVVCQELRRFLAEAYPEEEVGRLLREEFGCDYHPERHGMTCTAWLWQVHAALWRATHRTAK